MMNKGLLTALLTLSLTATAHAASAPTVIQLDPLPYGSVQLGYGQYMLPNIDGNLSVVVYSKVPLTFAEPGSAATPKVTLAISPLPAGTIRMNDTQYLLPNAMPQATVMVFSKTPLDFQVTSMTVAPTNVPAPLAAAPTQVQQPSDSSNLTPSTVSSSAPAASVKATPASASDAKTSAPTEQKLTVQPGPKVAETTSTTPTGTTPTPAISSLTTEVAENKLPGLPGLPESLKGNVTAVEKDGKLYFSYSLTNVGHDVYTLNPADLRVTQEGIGIRARLDRRNGNLTPGTLPPNRGEIGTITTTRKTSGPVTFKWIIRNAAGQSFTLTYQYDAAQNAALSGKAE